jgi:NADPH:quinone reductase-like Zn-dependent oxidoreductase
MKAIAIARQGAQPTLHRDLPIPEAAEGEVLVRVRASSVNGFDLAVANGYLQAMMEHRFPVVLGKDFAGTVENIGPGVDGIAPGDDVYGVVMRPYLGDGGLGEHVAAPAAFVAKVPAGVELATAGALGLAGTAAIDAVDAIAPNRPEVVLVAGATGGVGAIAVQLLKAKGVRVIATAATSQERAFVTELGADNAVDYRGDLAAAVKALQPGGVDAALHFAGDGPTIATVVRSGGRLASTLGLTADLVGRGDLTVFPIMANPVTATLDRLAAAVADGSVRVPIQRTYALADAPQAFADFAAGTLGKLAIVVE